jgi:hypothetical protein
MLWRNLFLSRLYMKSLMFDKLDLIGASTVFQSCFDIFRGLGLAPPLPSSLVIAAVVVPAAVLLLPGVSAITMTSLPIQEAEGVRGKAVFK